MAPTNVNPAGRWFADEQIAANCLFAFYEIASVGGFSSRYHKKAIIAISTIFLPSAISSGIPKSNTPEHPHEGALLSPVAPARITVNAPSMILVMNMAGFRKRPVRKSTDSAISTNESTSMSVCGATGKGLFIVERRYSKKCTAAEASMSLPTPETRRIIPRTYRMTTSTESAGALEIECENFMAQKYIFLQSFSSRIE